MDLLAATPDAVTAGLVGTAFTFGLRHGIDWDHLAAITDITSSQEEGRSSLILSSLYALGHAAVVLALGILAVVFGDLLPASVDVVMEKIVGVTLLALGAYVFYSLARYGRAFRLRSRWMLVFSGIRRAARWARSRREPVVVELEHDHPHEPDPLHDHAHQQTRESGEGAVLTKTATHGHRHVHVAQMPEDPFTNYGHATAFGVGMIHGVGAETPTQVLIFLAAAGAGGKAAGFVALVAFVAGLLVTNSLIALASTFGFLNAGRNFKVYASVAITTAVFSLILGALFIVGRGDVLPAFFSG